MTVYNPLDPHDPYEHAPALADYDRPVPGTEIGPRIAALMDRHSGHGDQTGWGISNRG